jgi:hypothetical protein
MISTIRWMLLLFASSLALTGCSQTVSPNVVDGSGFSIGHPKRETLANMTNNDLQFAQWYASHRETCLRMPGCSKK